MCACAFCKDVSFAASNSTSLESSAVNPAFPPWMLLLPITFVCSTFPPKCVCGFKPRNNACLLSGIVVPDSQF